MTATITSLYERRVELVKTTLKEHSKMSDKAALELAEHVLYAMDHIAETVR
ncbi:MULTISPECIES: DUF6307 family protein [unclassified Crossiella]|uniref:DUF6307 family protein n=1 Tax=unclassified Crossiella TaxID=2620835 RepID=UPI001FFE83B3|nr:MULTISPECIES: DUF6307 family protein [unclassified Crossiella]MCK2241280.1 DUF6307 family protein [Crossiella sp. S99.2]MCK2253576.1 DUF6307 family protein [Crossiella sp. S99.1]